MFSYDIIQKFNKTEIDIYKFVMAHIETIPYMSIRELSSSVHVSTATILRFCDKTGCNGYKNFKQTLKESLCERNETDMGNDLEELLNYFGRINTHSFEEKIERGAFLIRKADKVIFIGGGSSGTLARYGARYFSNLGKFSIGLEDTCYPIMKSVEDAVSVIVLSVSGETREIIDLIDRFKINKSNILSITNESDSTIAKMSDWNISYDMSMHKANGGYNATTQVPVLFLIEALARRL